MRYQDLDELFESLGRSRFRSRFRLRCKEAAYLREKGLERVLEHARDFVQARLADANPVNDGRQTPMRGHPVFIAQHATGTCCRKCLEKWYGIAKGKSLTEKQVDYIVEVLQRWIIKQKFSLANDCVENQHYLFKKATP
jgi:hypothetical protein